MNPAKIIEINRRSSQGLAIFWLQVGLLGGFSFWFGEILLLLLVLLAALYFVPSKQHTYILLDEDSNHIFLHCPKGGWQPATVLFACQWWMAFRSKGKIFVFYRDMMAREDYHYCLAWLLVHGASTVGKAQAKSHG